VAQDRAWRVKLCDFGLAANSAAQVRFLPLPAT
jgi:hypothetical protein